MKLRTKFAVVLVVVTIVLSAGVYGGLELYKRQLVGQAREDVNETARLAADQLDETVEEHQDFIGFVASRPEAARFNESDHYLNDFVDNSRFFAVQLVAANGTLIDFHGDVTQEIRQEAIGSDIGNRTYVREAAAGRVYTSDPEYTNATGKYLVIFSAPIFEDREVKEVLAASIYLDTRTFFGTLSPLATHDQAVRVRSESVVLYERGGPFAQTITATATVESTGWEVTVVRDRSGLITQLRALAIAQGIGIFLVMLSVVAFGVWEYRTTLNQTQRLLEGFEALGSGEFDHTLSLAAAEEWEQISEGFNDLAAGLAAREAELREHEQRLEVLNRVLRHNLRNTANVVIGYAEVIRDNAADETDVEAAENIIATAEELASLSEKAHQIESTIGIQGESNVLIEVTSIVGPVVERLREEYPDAEITTSLPEEAWVSAAPPLRIAIENICENACEHTEPPDARVDVSVSTDHDRVEIRIADNGPGIPEQERSVIEEGRETPLRHGSGLGLWLVKWVIDQSGGTLRFEGDGSDGSVVAIGLDRVYPEDGTAEPTEAFED